MTLSRLPRLPDSQTPKADSQRRSRLPRQKQTPKKQRSRLPQKQTPRSKSKTQKQIKSKTQKQIKDKRQITSLVGLNPIYKKSGTSLQSLYKISKSGSVFYRGSLFMGVMTAIRYDENFKAFYNRLKAKGKHTTQAQIAVMRKMIIVAHSLYKNKQQYIKKSTKPEGTIMD